MKEKRVEYLDFAKAIGIVLVVFNHLWQSSGKEDFLFLLISSFHMPLFFFLSGLFFSVTKYTFSEFVYKRIRQLLVPCVCFSMIVGLTDIVLSDGASFINMTHKLPGALWFLLVLFIVEILFWPIGYMLTNINVKYKKGGAYLIGTILLVVGYILQRNGYGESFYSTASLFYALMFYLIGHMSRNFLILERSKWNKIKYGRYIGYIVLSEVLLCGIVYVFRVKTILMDNTISPLIPGIAASIIGIALILLISLQIEAIGTIRIKKVLLSIGRNTLVIMSFHQIYMKLFVEYFKVYFTSFVLYQSVKVLTMMLFLYIMVKLINIKKSFFLGK